MDKKTIIAVIIAAGLTFLVTAFFTSGQEVVQAGLDAQVKEQIREVLQEEMKVDIDGETKTYGQVLSSLHTKVTAMQATIDILVED